MYEFPFIEDTHTIIGHRGLAHESIRMSVRTNLALEAWQIICSKTDVEKSVHAFIKKLQPTDSLQAWINATLKKSVMISRQFVGERRLESIRDHPVSTGGPLAPSLVTGHLEPGHAIPRA